MAQPTTSDSSTVQEDTSVFLSQPSTSECPFPLPPTQESTTEAPTPNKESRVQLSQSLSYSQLSELEIPCTPETPTKKHQTSPLPPTQESMTEAPTPNKDSCVQLSQSLPYSQLSELEIPCTQETPTKKHQMHNNPPECDSVEAPPKRSKTNTDSNIGVGRIFYPWSTMVMSHRKALVGSLTFNDSMYSMDAIKLAIGLAHLSGAPHAALYFSVLQSGFGAYNNNYIKKGPTLQLDIECQDIMDQEIHGIAIETNRMVKTMTWTPKWARKRTDGQLQQWVATRSRRQLCLIYVIFHLVKQLFGCAHRDEEIAHQDCFFFLQQLLVLCPQEEDCHKLMVQMVFGMETMQENVEFLSFIRNSWSSRFHGSHKTLLDKLGSISNSFDQDPELGQVLVDVWNLFHNRGKNSHILIGETKISNVDHRNTIRAHAPWYFRRAVMAKALSMCMTYQSTKDSLKNSLDFFGLVVQLQREENSDRWKSQRKGQPLVEGESDETNKPLDIDEWYLLKPLNESEKIKYETQLNKEDNEEEASREATVEAIKRLKGVVDADGEILIWLNSDPINYYFDQMATREKNLWDKGLTIGRCHCFKAFFYSQLMDIGRTHAFNYSNVKKFGQKCPGGNIFLLEKLLIPINQTNTHWMLVVVNFLWKTITIWDSYVHHNQPSHAGVTKNILKYLKLEYFAIHKGTKAFSALGEWKLQSYRDVLKQTNGDDCGIFTIMHADIILRGYQMSILRNALQIEEKYDEIIRRCRDRLATMMLNEEQFNKD